MYSDDLLDQGFSSEPVYAKFPIAGRGKRFANYVIDRIAFTIFGLVIGILLGLFAPWVMNTALFSDNSLMEYLLGAVIMLIYYPLTEGLMGGKSLGKVITKTRATKRDGNPVSMEDVLLRTLIRIIPFDALSFLGGDPVIGWHDKWAKTIVIDESPKSGERSKWD